MRFRGTAAFIAWAAALVVAGSPAQAAAKGHDELVPASGRLAGMTGGRLLGQEVRLLLELPPTDNPLNGVGGSCFGAGRHDKVLIVWTRPEPPTCVVKPGTPVFLFTFFVECSAVEAPPFFGATAEAQRQCALEDLRTFGVYDANLVSIDGGPATDVYSDRYLAVSPQLTARLPDPNILGVSAASTTFVSAAWVAMIRPLPPGTHTIRVQLVHTDGTSEVSEAIVDVVPGLPGRRRAARAHGGR